MKKIVFLLGLTVMSGLVKAEISDTTLLGLKIVENSILNKVEMMMKETEYAIRFNRLSFDSIQDIGFSNEHLVYFMHISSLEYNDYAFSFGYKVTSHHSFKYVKPPTHYIVFHHRRVYVSFSPSLDMELLSKTAFIPFDYKKEKKKKRFQRHSGRILDCKFYNYFLSYHEGVEVMKRYDFPDNVPKNMRKRMLHSDAYWELD